MRTVLPLVVIALALSDAASAQSLTIQQPVVETFSVNTVVSVPDRGSILLGSVSGARDSRTWNGFSPIGSSLGTERNYSSARATVYIHDFAEIDAALLAEAAATRPTPLPTTSPLAANAMRQLQRNSIVRSDRLHPVLPRTVSPIVKPADAGHSEPASVAAASRSTNSGVNPAANRASR